MGVVRVFRSGVLLMGLGCFGVAVSTRLRRQGTQLRRHGQRRPRRGEEAGGDDPGPVQGEVAGQGNTWKGSLRHEAMM